MQRDGFIILYALILLGSFMLISLDNFDFITNVTAVTTCLSNVGPGLAMGPVENLSFFSGFRKALCFAWICFGQIIGNFPDYYAFRSFHLEKELHVTTQSQASAKKEQLTCLHDRLFFLLQIFGERHNEKMRSIFEMGSALLHVKKICYRYERVPQREKCEAFFEMNSALLHADVLISILQKKPCLGCFFCKGRVYYYDKPNIGSCLFFLSIFFLPDREGVPAAFREEDCRRK